MRIPDEETIEPGHTVIELIDGEPYIYTQPDRPWKFAGPITRDDPISLRFPEVSRRPGIYRVTVYYREPRPPARYVGQAKKDLRKRFWGYRSRGRNPANPPGTTTLLAREYLDALDDGATVSLEIIDDPEIGLTNDEVRDNLERKYIAEIDETRFEVLNRAHRPR
jgi:hypothetical protein